MKVVAISDVHGRLPGELPEGDLLLIVGDVCPLWDHDRKVQANWLRSDFTDWLNSLPYPSDRIVGVGGNHDFVLQDSKRMGADLPWTYLRDESIVIDGVNIHGSPMSNRFGGWAFMADDITLGNEHWSKIPDDVHILMTHGPALGIGDLTSPHYGSVNAGSKTLRERLLDLHELKLHVFGHIHEGRGRYDGRYIAANVTHHNEDYSKTYGAMEFDLDV